MLCGFRRRCPAQCCAEGAVAWRLGAGHGPCGRDSEGSAPLEERLPQVLSSAAPADERSAHACGTTGASPRSWSPSSDRRHRSYLISSSTDDLPIPPIPWNTSTGSSVPDAPVSTSRARSTCRSRSTKCSRRSASHANSCLARLLMVRTSRCRAPQPTPHPCVSEISMSRLAAFSVPCRLQQVLAMLGLPHAVSLFEPLPAGRTTAAAHEVTR